MAAALLCLCKRSCRQRSHELHSEKVSAFRNGGIPRVTGRRMRMTRSSPRMCISACVSKAWVSEEASWSLLCGVFLCSSKLSDFINFEPGQRYLTAEVMDIVVDGPVVLVINRFLIARGQSFMKETSLPQISWKFHCLCDVR